MQTIKGGSTLRQAMIDKHGSYEAYIAYMRRLASVGGQRSNNGGFASKKVGADGLTGRARASVVGRRGGRISKRTKSDDTFAASTTQD